MICRLDPIFKQQSTTPKIKIKKNGGNIKANVLLKRRSQIQPASACSCLAIFERVVKDIPVRGK